MDFPSSDDSDSSSDYIGKKSACKKAPPPRQHKKLGNAAAPSAAVGKKSHKAVPKGGKRNVATLPFLRESVGTETITSSLFRITAAEDKVLKKRYPGLIHSYKYFECSQVNKDNVRDAEGYRDLLHALENGLPGLELPSIDGVKPLVVVLVVNLARLGRNEAQLRAVMDDLKKAANGKFDVQIMALDCFGLTEDSIPVLAEYYRKKKSIDDEFGPHDNPMKKVPASHETKKEREAVKSNVPIIKSRLKRGDGALKKMIKNGIEKSGELMNLIFTQGGLDEFTLKYIKVANEITKDSDLEGEAMKSFIVTKVKELAQLVTKYTGQRFTAFYFRRSQTTGNRDTILAFDSVPAEQYAYGHADLEFLRKVPKTDELGIYFDDQKNRDQLTNPQYILYLAAVLSGAIDTAVISEPNRIDRSRWLVELHQQACKLSNTTIIFSKAIGRSVERIAYNEEMGKKAREEATLERIQTIDGFRKKLPKTTNPNDGFIVTCELSEAMEFVGSCKLRKNEMGAMEFEESSKLNQI